MNTAVGLCCEDHRGLHRLHICCEAPLCCCFLTCPVILPAAAAPHPPEAAARGQVVPGAGVWHDPKQRWRPSESSSFNITRQGGGRGGRRLHVCALQGELVMMCRLLYLLYLQAEPLTLLMLSVFGTGGEGADRHRLQTEPDVYAHCGQAGVRCS